MALIKVKPSAWHFLSSPASSQSPLKLPTDAHSSIRALLSVSGPTRAAVPSAVEVRDQPHLADLSRHFFGQANKSIAHSILMPNNDNSRRDVLPTATSEGTRARP